MGLFSTRLLALALFSAQASVPEDAPVADAPSQAQPDVLPSESEASFEVPSRIQSPPITRARRLPPEQDLLLRARKGPDGRLWASHQGHELPLTVVPELQASLTRILQSYETPYAAVVALDPNTGRVLAMAEHSQVQPELRGLCTQAVYPAASIFKIVTAGALLEAGVPPSETACFHGGKRRLSEKLLVDSERDRHCYPLSTAMAMSANVVFAKLTQRHLSPSGLMRAAQAFGFNRPIAFPIPTDVSLAAVPSDPFELSTTAAGFGDVYLSPLHGALIAAVAARRGTWPTPVLFDEPAAAAEDRRVLSEGHAEALAEMLEETVTRGTARQIFRERGYRVEGAVGKTGSLADRNPYRDYSWFVGFAPKHEPQVAVAAVIVNDYRWRIRATWLGREAMRLYLDGRKKAAAHRPTAVTQ